jgi:hypothetical protein
MPAPFRALALSIALVAAPLTAVAAQQAVGPTAATANVGYRASAGENTALQSAVNDAGRNNEGLDIGLMVGGGAALIIGIVVGSVGGIVLALAGVLVAIVGLVLFLR